jgi:hypothetical protein
MKPSSQRRFPGRRDAIYRLAGPAGGEHEILVSLRKDYHADELVNPRFISHERFAYPALRMFHGKAYFLMSPSSRPALPWTGKPFHSRSDGTAI